MLQQPKSEQGVARTPVIFYGAFTVLVKIAPGFSDGTSILSHSYICSCQYGTFSDKVHSCKWRGERTRKKYAPLSDSHVKIKRIAASRHLHYSKF